MGWTPLVLPGTGGGTIYPFLRMTISLDLLVLRRRPKLVLAAQLATWPNCVRIVSLLNASVIK